tara:strand:- start:4235 stop:5971 length:1737 start_codon:yes stop_codon:yes gene_type:complete
MNSNFHIVNLEAYKTPEVYEDPHQDFVSFGDNNNFYQELINAYLNSPTTNSIITGVVGQIYGKGFSALDSNRRPDQFAAFKRLFKASDLKRVCLDYKLLGEAALQVTYKGKKVDKVTHFNRETLRAEKCDHRGFINAYYYYPKWEEYQEGDKLTRIPVFGSGAKNEIYVIRKHIPSMHYYSPPPEVSSINYSNLEALISSYLVNEVTNNFSSGKLISMTNGVPTLEKQQMIKSEIMEKLTGVNGEKVIVSFSDSPENKTTIEDISAADSAEIYQYIAEECTRKLLLAHRITSPLLVGIRDNNNGLGSNSEEIQNAHNLFENVVIKPYQNDIIDAIDDILAVNGIALKIYVQTLTPIEFTDETLVTQEQKEEETGQKLSSDIDVHTEELVNDLGDNEKTLFDLGYELIDEREVDYDQEENLDKQIHMASAPKGRATAPSELDGKTNEGFRYLVRYQYAPLAVSKNSREFCKKMVRAKRVYRKEDLDRDFKGNKEFNPSKGDSYNLFLYKGGVNCKHYFNRKTYLLKDDKKIDPNNPNAAKDLIYKTEIAKKGIKPPSKDEEPAIVSEKMIDRADKGRKN